MLLCEIAERFPNFAADFLERGQKLRKTFREETVTDLLMSTLIPLRPLGVCVDYPLEDRTGADMEWCFVSQSRKKIFRFIIQAKKLSINAKNWKNWKYEELAYPNKTGVQAKLLVKTAKEDGAVPTYPLYAFYNPRRSCGSSAMPKIEGVNLADGHIIGSIILRRSKGYNKVINLHQSFFSLRQILCLKKYSAMLRYVQARRVSPDLAVGFMGAAPFDQIFALLTPEIMRDRLENLRNEVLKNEAAGFGFTDLPMIPQVQGDIPPEITNAINFHLNGEGGERPKIKHWRAIFAEPNGFDELWAVRGDPRQSGRQD